MLLVTMTTVSFYFITIYTPTFGKHVLGLTGAEALLVTLCVGVSNFCWLPVMGALSDRVGRRPLLLASTLLALATAYPAMCWLVAAPSLKYSSNAARSLGSERSSCRSSTVSTFGISCRTHSTAPTASASSMTDSEEPWRGDLTTTRPSA